VDAGLAFVVAFAWATTGHAAMGRQPGVMEVEACLDPPLVGATPTGDAAVVATMDANNSTPSPQTTSADRRLKSFTKRIIKAR
jgi:hypothetical protein